MLQMEWSQRRENHDLVHSNLDHLVVQLLSGDHEHQLISGNEVHLYSNILIYRSSYSYIKNKHTTMFPLPSTHIIHKLYMFTYQQEHLLCHLHMQTLSALCHVLLVLIKCRYIMAILMRNSQKSALNLVFQVKTACMMYSNIGIWIWWPKLEVNPFSRRD